MGDEFRLDIDGGKYTIVKPVNAPAYVLRYGEPWLHDLYNVAGNNCWLAMAYELAEVKGLLND